MGVLCPDRRDSARIVTLSEAKGPKAVMAPFAPLRVTLGREPELATVPR